MKRHCKFKKIVRLCIVAAIMLSLLVTACGCHVFPWFIPKPYSDKQMAEIYDYLKNDLLVNLDHYIAGVSYEENGLWYSYNVFASEGKVIINYDIFNESNQFKYGLYHDGVLKEWDIQERKESTRTQDIADYQFLFDSIRATANYFINDVLDNMPYREDSYCHEMFPWGMGMAQMYYLPNDESLSVSASWTVEKRSELNKLPLIYSGEFYCGTDTQDVRLEAYGSPYGIDERIENIKDNYEQRKETDINMLHKSIYIKTGSETLHMELYNTDAAKALVEKLSDSDVTVTVDDYGGFEKVGALGFDLPTSDERITTQCCDVMLYQGDQIVIFYGQNTWSYTKLGYITGYSDAAFADVLGAGNGKLTLTLTLSAD